MSESCQLLLKFQGSWSLKVLGMFKRVGLGVQQGTGWLSAAFWHQGFRPETIARGSTRKEVLGHVDSPASSSFFLPFLPPPPSSACSHWAGSSRQHEHLVGAHSSAPGASSPLSSLASPPTNSTGHLALVPSTWEAAALCLHSLIHRLSRGPVPAARVNDSRNLGG